jgi:hypothetical protein
VDGNRRYPRSRKGFLIWPNDSGWFSVCVSNHRKRAGKTAVFNT